MTHIRQIVGVAVLALCGTVPVAACAGADSLSPLPVRAAESGPAASAGTPPAGSSAPVPATSSPPRVAGPPARTRTVRPTPTTTSTSSCLGAVRYDLDLQNTELELVRPMCFHTGGVLRLQGTGPGLVIATPESVVSSSYAGGVEDLHFIRPGTATVTIPRDERTYTLTVVVIS